MPRVRKFLNKTVLEAAWERMEFVHEIMDDVAIQFSGGKDSTAVLLLAKLFYEKHNLGPVKVIFRDEEMVSPSVARYVEWIRSLPWVDMHVFALPVGQEVWVLGKREYVLLWSPQRASEDRLIRPMMEGSITAEDFGLDPTKPITESIDYYTMSVMKGKSAFITGVRANESMIRYRSIVQKLDDKPWLAKPYKLPRNVPLQFAKVIYDWTTNDVLKFLSDNEFPYCEYYDWAAVSGSNTRVGIPLHSVAIRRLGDVVATEPEFYDRLYECFPQIDAQRRYWKDFDVEALIASYVNEGWDGVRACIQDNMLTPGLEKTAMAYAAAFRKKNKTDPYSFPMDQLIRTLLLNEFHTTAITPVGPGTRADRMRRAQAENDANSLDLIDDAV